MMKLKLILLLTFTTLLANNYDDAIPFIESCVDHYDFKVEGRYTHEYHPFILDRSVESLYQLNDWLSDEGLGLKHHIVITGYEGNAIQSYYTDYNKMKINDEMTSKGSSGWSLKLHNYFGLMTGFLFKDFNPLHKRWFNSEEPVVEHINPKSVEIYNDQSGIFQKHAFDSALNYMQDEQLSLETKLHKQNYRGIYEQLVSYWEDLYQSEVKISGNQVAATQDILFSIDYCKYILKSNLPIKKFYVGGDITYPIEKSVKQGEDATKNAQTFVKKFAKILKPVEGKKTVYVFNSFVDGVGKSTMLGNVKNWIKYQDRVDLYERVDNSSSQWAEVFKFNDDVYIADLPAQMSHFTYKPDGLVYVDVETEQKEDEISHLRQHILSNIDVFANNYRKDLEEVRKTFSKEGGLAKKLNDSNAPHKTFIRNLLFLGRDDVNGWIPFSYEDKHYLFNIDRPNEIRVLRDLGGAASHGLKNIESEQMLFYEGVRFPVDYKKFMQDLSTKLKDNGVENVVFVDFLSMYPRSSRENIRVNYLLQQMAILNHSFLTSKTLYKNFVNASELYCDLLSPRTASSMKRYFKLEILVRYALYKLLKDLPSLQLEGLTFSEVTDLISKELKNIGNDENIKNYLKLKSDKKFVLEKNSLEEVFGLTKEFVNIQHFSFKHLLHFSQILEWHFAETLKNKPLNDLWYGLNSDIYSGENYQKFRGNVSDQKNILKLESDQDLWVLFDFPMDNREASLVGPCFRTIRANWYAAISNILFNTERYPVIPMVAKLGSMNPSENNFDRVYIAQKMLPDWDGNKQHPPRKFGVRAKASYGEFDNKAYCLDWDKNGGTNSGLFAFGLSAYRNQKYSFSSPGEVDKILNKYSEENGSSIVMPASKLHEELQKSQKWNDEFNNMLYKASQNGEYDVKFIKSDLNSYFGKKSFYMGPEVMRPSARLFVRMIATLEMILKDPLSEIAVRSGNREDFAAALQLIEQVTLPKHYGIVFQSPLFDDYEKVDPVIPWDYFR